MCIRNNLTYIINYILVISNNVLGVVTCNILVCYYTECLLCFNELSTYKYTKINVLSHLEIKPILNLTNTISPLYNRKCQLDM